MTKIPRTRLVKIATMHELTGDVHKSAVACVSWHSLVVISMSLHELWYNGVLKQILLHAFKRSSS